MSAELRAESDLAPHSAVAVSVAPHSCQMLLTYGEVVRAQEPDVILEHQSGVGQRLGEIRFEYTPPKVVVGLMRERKGNTVLISDINAAHVLVAVYTEGGLDQLIESLRAFAPCLPPPEIV